MIPAIALALSPFILNTVMGVVKWLSPLETTASKRVVLALMSLAGVIATSAMNGTPIDPNAITSIVQTLIETFVAFLLAHGSYTLFWEKAKPTNDAVANLIAE